MLQVLLDNLGKQMGALFSPEAKTLEQQRPLLEAAVVRQLPWALGLCRPACARCPGSSSDMALPLDLSRAAACLAAPARSAAAAQVPSPGRAGRCPQRPSRPGAPSEAARWSSRHPRLPRAPPPAPCAQATFAQLKPLTLEHLAEEEAEAMPLMRRHFKPEEISKHVVTKVGAGRTPPPPSRPPPAGVGAHGALPACPAAPAARLCGSGTPRCCDSRSICQVAGCVSLRRPNPCFAQIVRSMDSTAFGVYMRHMSREQFRSFAK